MLASREVGDRIRHLYTPGDYTALANGDTQLGIQGVKFVYDLASGGVVHLLSNAKWPLHYTFIREQIYLQPPLDRCDAEQRQEFDQGWYDFSVTEYFAVEGRSFLLGTLSHHSSTALNAVEFAVGDVIDGEQMKDAFFAVGSAHPQSQSVDGAPPSARSGRTCVSRQRRATARQSRGSIREFELGAPQRWRRWRCWRTTMASFAFPALAWLVSWPAVAARLARAALAERVSAAAAGGRGAGGQLLCAVRPERAVGAYAGLSAQAAIRRIWSAHLNNLPTYYGWRPSITRPSRSAGWA